MPEIEISKIKARRGTDAQRKLIVLDQGELAYTLDTKRLFIGNGASLGGDVVGNKIHPPLSNTSSLTTLKAEVGDIVAVNKIFYQLISPDYTNISNWREYKFNIDDVIFSFDENNALTLNDNAISAKYIDPSTVSNGLKIESGVLQTNFQTKSLEISAFKLSIKQSGIDEREISSSTLINGLTGGSGNKIGVNTNPNYFYFNASNQLDLSGFNPFALRFSNLNPLWFGAGLNYNPTLSVISTTLTDTSDASILKDVNGEISINPSVFGSGLSYDVGSTTLTTVLTDVNGNNTIVKNLTGGIGVNPSLFGSGLVYNSTIPSLSTVVSNVDGVSILNTNGTIRINNTVAPGTAPLSKTTIDAYGRVISQTNSIVSSLTGANTLNATNTLSSIFNGSLVSNTPGINTTIFQAISSNGSTLALSSAGFITFEGSMTTQEGQTLKRFAIPVFTF